MNTVGQFVQQAIDLMNGGSHKLAFLPTARAIEETIKKISGKQVLSDDDYKRFLKANWQLIVFMGMPRALPLPPNIPFGFKRLVPQFNVHQGVEEIIFFLIRQTLMTGKLPLQFGFNTDDAFAVKKNQLLLPRALGSGLLGVAVVQEANKNETIGDKYWMNISDFKMFISELWGRKDLAQRIMNFYLERD